jgi:hypothetical protein
MQTLSQWRTVGIRESLLKKFEAEMNVVPKVKDSADAATFLHSEIASQSR